MKRFIIYAALAGVFVPIAIMIALQLEQWAKVFFWWLHLVAIILWPTSFLLMAAECATCSPFDRFSILVLVISIGINVALYSGVGAIFWLLLGRPFKW